MEEQKRKTIERISKKIIPKILKRKLSEYYRQLFVRNLIVINDNIPKFEIKTTNIKNLRALLNREELLEMLPKNAVIAEIGVDKGSFSELILKTNYPFKLHLIDSWSDTRYNSGLKEYVEKKFEDQIKKGTVEINIGKSTEVVQIFEDKYFDWIYIDTDHSYQLTKLELELYSKKVKDNGIVAGHDFIVGNWKGMYRYGVIEAVYEFCLKNDWEIIFITMENKTHPSFAIRRISE
jgi:hypothetical protein